MTRHLTGHSGHHIRFRAAVLVPSVIAASALAISVLLATGGNPFPGSGTSPPPASAPASHSVRYEVSSSRESTAAISFVTAANGSTTRAANQPLPWSAVTEIGPGPTPFAQVTVRAVAAGHAAEQTVTTCRIIADGRLLAENHTTSTGTSFVDCDAVIR